MSTLLWWLIPVGATMLALAWAAMRSRPRRPLDTHSSLSDMARFRAAMGRPMPDGSDPAPVSPRRPARASRPPRRPPAGSTGRPARRSSGHGGDGRQA